jgi:hypothetical protein
VKINVTDDSTIWKANIHMTVEDGVLWYALDFEPVIDVERMLTV